MAEAEELPEDTSVGIPLGPSISSGAAASDANYCYLILFNLNKKNNLGAILRSAAAFGVRLVLLVGRQGFKAFCKKSGQGVVPIENAPSVQEAVDALKARHPPGKLQVCGVEILPQAQSLHSSPFHGPTAFMVGNERGGLTREQIDHCDSFVYIPQFGGGVGSLNVACACSVATWRCSVFCTSSAPGPLPPQRAWASKRTSAPPWPCPTAPAASRCKGRGPCRRGTTAEVSLRSE
ncbi:unnamed protein product [Durusdinium trenchii]|uniref:tRNA/rRNA methyltransferase SpoU type domain-containing protein n=1 Tax=Durusdinium trenchii TaxID=1381693 RepID=A0ABP0L6H6_9DINO